MSRTRERSTPSPRLDHVRRAKLGVVQARVGAIGTSRVRDRLAGRIDQDGTCCKPLLVTPESDWKLNHLAGTNCARPTVNHLVQHGKVTVRVANPTIGRTRRSRSFGHSSADDGWCHPEKTREARHSVTGTRLVPHAVRLAVPVEITTVGRHKVHHFVVPDGARVGRFASVRQTLVVLEDALRNSVAFRECEPPCFISSHVPRDILVDRSFIIQTERIIIAVVVVTTH